ncbi:unnamed protein product [Parnassius apollo]|uniref:(apollo) hypothetical protein n=1 Tax=Parnassius apollo TaxID=110799 RepID=A0A8S3W1Y4_PARAO|nr:unnamed protein product [Parnassius apollo]
MVKFKGHNIMKQYMQNKPVKRGFNMWCRADSKTGYLLQFDFYTDKIKIFATLKYKTVNGNNGQKHWKITGYDYSYDLIERVYIKLENLFNGDETRAKPILDILNNSWKELITEIGAPTIKELIAKAVDSIKKFFLAVPTTELELL